MPQDPMRLGCLEERRRRQRLPLQLGVDPILHQVMGSSMVVEATALGAAAVEVAKITISGPRATARLAATGATTRSPGLPTWTMSLLETTVDQAETAEVSTRLSRDWKA